MVKVNFIRFFPSLDEALSIRTSPDVKYYTTNGINILPFDLIKTRQMTDHKDGVSVEDWFAYIVNLRTGVETDITANFVIEEVLSDENGKPQILWSVSNLPKFGSNLVYLKIQQAIGQDFYSNVFTIDDVIENHAHIHYKNNLSDKMLSIGILTWFVEDLKQTELKNYYETSTKSTVTLTIKSQKFEKWITDIINRDLAIKISDLFEYKFVYLDNVRANLFEAIEIPEIESMSVTKRYKLKINFSKDDVFDPFAVEELIQVIPVINLISVNTNGSIAIFDFTFSNFSPSFLTFDYSQNQTTWVSENSGFTSTQSISFSNIGIWYFRVRHPLAISNVIELNIDSVLVANNDDAQVVKGGSVNIPVLFNDVLSGNVSITSVATPINGIVVINSNNTVTYTHNGTSSTFDSFSYTISNGVTNSTGIVGVAIIGTSGVSTPFLTSAFGSSSSSIACSFILDTTRYHSGGSALPTLDNFIFADASLTQPFNGGNNFYAIGNGRIIQINNEGRIINIGACTSGGVSFL